MTNRAEKRREKRYAQRHFWTASALGGFGVQLRRARLMALAQTKPNDVETQMLIFHWGNAQKLTPRDIRQPKLITNMKQHPCQNRKVSKTSGESKILEGRMIIKNEIVKIHWIFMSFLKAPKRHVHETVENVTPAQRCKIHEIGAT